MFDVLAIDEYEYGEALCSLIWHEVIVLERALLPQGGLVLLLVGLPGVANVYLLLAQLDGVAHGVPIAQAKGCLLVRSGFVTAFWVVPSALAFLRCEC